jgi:Conserved in the green lineage and diatoms 27
MIFFYPATSGLIDTSRPESFLLRLGERLVHRMHATLLARLVTFLVAAAGATTAYRAVLVAQQQRRSLGSRNRSLSRRRLPIVPGVRHLSKQQDEFESLRPETNFGSESVPENQRPVNEYLDITSQPLFGWAATGTQGLLVRLVIFYGAFFGLVCYPISGATFTQDGYLVQKLAASNVGAMFVLFLLLIRLYSGWGYIGQRLSSKVVEFEETGWYDGDWEEKTETELKRDRMLFANEVKPVVDRLKLFTIGSGGLLLASIISFNVALSAKPMFDQYDPNVLGRLSYDDRLADSAAVNTGGRPAYCESRYYRAVANGGMGCD